METTDEVEELSNDRIEDEMESKSIERSEDRFSGDRSFNLDQNDEVKNGNSNNEDGLNEIISIFFR